LIRPSLDLHVSRTEKDMTKLLALYELGLADGKIAANRLIGSQTGTPFGGGSSPPKMEQRTSPGV
jgi:hypothetical protein